MASEAIVPRGVGAGGAIGIGRSVAEATTAKTIASNVKANIAASQAGRASSNFDIHIAKSNQIRLNGAMLLIHGT